MKSNSSVATKLAGNGEMGDLAVWGPAGGKGEEIPVGKGEVGEATEGKGEEGVVQVSSAPGWVF